MKIVPVVLALTLLSLAFTGVEGIKCTAAEKLQLVTLNASFTDAKCQDGSAPAFYVGGFDPLNPVVKPVIIWLGDSQVCSNETTCNDICDGTGRSGGPGVCQDAGVSTANVFGSTSDVEDVDEIGIDVARCLYSRVICTSEWWDDFEELTPGSLLCEDIPFYADYLRVFAPSCSLDYWVGQGDVSNPGSPRFRGAFNFKGIIQSLIESFGLGLAPRIVLGGTRGAGIGAVHLTEFMEDILNNNDNRPDDPTENNTVSRQILNIVDSAWYVNFEEFAPNDEEKSTADGVLSLDNHFKVNTSNWIGNAVLQSDCIASKQPSELYKCLYLSEVLINLPASTTRRIMVIQSQYDIVQLFELGLADPDASQEFGDDSSFAQGAIGFVENYGQEVRLSLQSANDLLVDFRPTGKFFFYSTVCAQHGYIVPTQIHSLDPRRETIGDAGSIQFQRDEEVWEQVSSEDLVLFSAVQRFIDTDGAEIVASEPSRTFLGDTCGRFLCNDACSTEIVPFAVSAVFDACLQQMVTVYAVVTLLLFLIPYCLAYYQLRRWKRKTKNYWKRIRIIEELETMQTDAAFQQTLEGELKKGGSEQMKKMRYENKRTVAEVEEQLIIESNTGEYREVHLMVENLKYWAPSKKSCLGRQRYFQVLNDVNLGYDPGKVHALMGPSGSGKSTLLDILSLTRSTGKMQGEHYINGVPSHTSTGSFITEWFKHNSSYVSQQDVLFPQLTVREHLEHAAWLMLPEYMPDDAKLRRVWQFLRLLDLSAAADTLCGDGGVTVQGGLSGGQRRRVSVATALLRNPSVVFLDEPTSGLDSYSALSLVERMFNLAHNTSVNVIMTIHQPRKEIFKFIDDVTILNYGRVVFYGATDKSVDFFELDRYTANIGNDIIDYLDEVTADELEMKITNYENGPEGETNRAIMQSEKTDLDMATAKELREVLVYNSLAEGRWSWTASGSAPWLQWILIARTLKRGGFDILLTMAYSLVGGLFLGSIFIGQTDYRSRVALLYLTVACITFFQGIFLANRYFDEKKMFDYEKKSGTMKSATAFIASQFTRDCVAACSETIVFIIPLIFLGGLSFEVERLLRFIVLCLLVAYTTTCLNVLIETQIDNVERAAITQVFVLGIGALFNGFIINLADLPFWLTWLPYIMLSFWGFVGVLINELGNYTLPCDTTVFSVLECTLRTGDIIIRGLNYDDFDVAECTAVLVIMIFLFRIAAFANFWLKHAQVDRIRIIDDGTRNTARTGSFSSFGSFGSSKSNLMESLEGSDTQLGKTVTKIVAAKSKMNLMSESTKKEENLRIAPKAFDLDEEDDYDDDITEFTEEENFGRQGFIESTLTSRSFLTGFFVFDVYSSAYVCFYRNELSVVFLIIAGLLFFVYAVQFLYQGFFFIPYTVDGAGRDFVWASEYDFPALVTLVVDVCLFILQFTASDSFQVRLILALILRGVRGVRVSLFWLKVDKSHRVTADSFLEFKQAEIDLIVEQGVGKGPLGRLTEDVKKRLSANRMSFRPGSARVSGRFGGVSRVSTKFNREALKKALAQTGTTAGVQTDSYGAAPPRPPRPTTKQIERSQKKPVRPERPTTNIGTRLTGIGVGRQRGSGNTPLSNRRTAHAESGGSAQWKRFKNNQNGKTIYYNPYTGEVLEGAIPTMGGGGANDNNQPGFDEV